MGGKSSKGVKCDICAITLNSEAQAQQHYSGKNHLKKLRAAQGGGEPREKGERIRSEAAVQSQKAVTAYLKSKQLLPSCSAL